MLCLKDKRWNDQRQQLVMTPGSQVKHANYQLQVPLGGHGNLVTQTCDLTISTCPLHTKENPITNTKQSSISNITSTHQNCIVHFPGTFGDYTVVLITLQVTPGCILIYDHLMQWKRFDNFNLCIYSL